MTENAQHSPPTPSRLPPLTTFIGRDVELDEIPRLLRERRLVTLTGTGGAGKTRLATETAARLAADYPDGVYQVELAPLARPELVVETVAHVLGVVDAPDPPGAPSLLDALAASLGPRRTLLVLDNCEHLLDACAHLCYTLLAAAPNLRVLATSREPLGLDGECLLRVPLLSLPGLDPPPSAATLPEFEAVRLFQDRARLVDPGFTLTERNAPAIAQVCVRLDGIPLALELAAAALRALPIGELAARLDGRFRLLTTGDRTALPRHQTLHALLDWSYQLLDARQQVVLRRLAAFPADWTLDAAEAVGAGEPGEPGGAERLSPEDVLDSVLQLVNKSLVQLDRGTERYRMLETVRLYALGNLRAAGEEGRTAERHAAWYLAFVEKGGAQVGGADQQAWFERLEREQPNLRAALSGTIAAGRAEEGARLALALWTFWIARAYHAEARRWLEAILALPARPPLAGLLRARLVGALGSLLLTRNEREQGRRYQEESLRLWREHGDPAGIAAALLAQGWHHFQAMDLDVARRLAEESLALARVAGDPRAVAPALLLFALASGEAGLRDGVVPALEESLRISRDLGAWTEVAHALNVLAGTSARFGDLERARPLLLEAVRLQVALGNHSQLFGCLVAMMGLARGTGPRPAMPLHMARVLGAMDALTERVGNRQSRWSTERDIPIRERLAAEIGEARLAREFAAGRALTVEGIVALAEEIAAPAAPPAEPVPPTAPPRPDGAYPDRLTRREVEVLRLVAAGLTNAQAAVKLSVTPRTINGHLTSIYSKTGVTSRAGAVRFALDHGLA